MTTSELQQTILEAKARLGVCVLAHAYMSPEICEVADYVGDSFGLAQKAAENPAQKIVMCGVRFMAETVKILSPEKTVVLPNPEALCPMAEQIEPELLAQLKETYPGYTVVAYVNTTAATKTLADVCVTSSSAEKIVRAIPNDKILFVPDCNLGDYIQKQVPEKTIALMRGGCPSHVRVTAEDVKRAKALHPEALFLVHPECRPEVTAMADYVGSTTGIMAYAEKSEAREFIIGTENSIVQHLELKCPDKRFWAVSKDCVCHNMKAVTLTQVLRAVLGEGGETIALSDETIAAARRSIDAMLRLGA